MKRFAFFATALITVLSLSTTVWAQSNKTGVELAGGGGVNLCIASGDADCENVDPSFSVLLNAGYRFMNILGIYIDFNYSQLSFDVDGTSETINSIHVMPTLRGFTTFGDAAEVYAGLGFGYASWSFGEGDNEATWSSLAGLKAVLGGGYYVQPNLLVGAEVDFIVHMDETGEACVKLMGQETCGDNEGDLAELLQIMAFAKYRIPM